MVMCNFLFVCLFVCLCKCTISGRRFEMQFKEGGICYRVWSVCDTILTNRAWLGNPRKIKEGKKKSAAVQV